MLIKPLSMPAIDWPTWNTVRRSTNQPPVSRELDAQHIALDQPSALPLALNMYALRHSLDHILRLVSLGFLICFDDDCTLVNSVLSLHQGRFYTQDAETILVGDLVEWRFSVLAWSNNSDPRIRIIGNTVFTHLVHAGLKELWYDYKRTMLADKTFNLRK